MPRLRKFACKLTRNTDAAEDLLQDTVLRALEKKEDFASGTNLFGWVSKIMFNFFVSRYRRAVKFDTQYDPEPAIAGLAGAGSQEETFYFRQVGKALSGLQPEFREILLLAADGNSYDEMAGRLGIPTGTVRSRLCRARKFLQLALEKPVGVPSAMQSRASRPASGTAGRIRRLWPFFRKAARVPQHLLPSRKALRGKAHNTKLTEAQALRVIQHTGPIQPLADELGVSYMTVSHIKKGRSWRHLPRPEADSQQRAS